MRLFHAVALLETHTRALLNALEGFSSDRKREGDPDGG
jgi:hypothetical protein